MVGFWRLIVLIVSVFPIITNTLFGLKSAEPILHELFTLHHVGRGTRLRKLLFPAALPAMFTGFRISASMAVLWTIVADPGDEMAVRVLEEAVTVLER